MSEHYAVPGTRIARPNRRMVKMLTKEDAESYLELYDVAKKGESDESSLAEIRFIPRTGERIFISHNGPGNWDSYTVVAVEYFLGYDPSTGEPSRSVSRGIGVSVGTDVEEVRDRERTRRRRCLP
jgi:hypothetical protein